MYEQTKGSSASWTPQYCKRQYVKIANVNLDSRARILCVGANAFQNSYFLHLIPASLLMSKETECWSRSTCAPTSCCVNTQICWQGMLFLQKQTRNETVQQHLAKAWFEFVLDFISVLWMRCSDQVTAISVSQVLVLQAAHVKCALEVMALKVTDVCLILFSHPQMCWLG